MYMSTMMSRRFSIIALLILSLVLVFTPTQVNAMDTEYEESLRRLGGNDGSTPPPEHHHKEPSSRTSSATSGDTSSATSGGTSSARSGDTAAARSGVDGTHAAASSQANGPMKKNTLLLVGAASMAGAVIAAAAYRSKRQFVVVESHPLEGALNKRMHVFSNLAGKAGKNAARPDRVVNLDGVAEASSTSYAVMGESGITVV